MKPPPVRYVAARSLDEAVATLHAEGADAKVLAGGQSLMPMLNFRLVRPSVLLDINRLPGLSEIEETPAGLRIGALTRHTELERSALVRRHYPVLGAAMGHVAHLAVRNRGTAGGSMSHADPAAELPMLARLLGAGVNTVSPVGTRTHDADRFFVSALTTALAHDEIVTSIDLPFLPPGTGWGFEEHARRHGDYALASAAATLGRTRGRIARVRLALMGVGDTPLRMEAAEAALEGQLFGAESLGAAVQAVRASVQPNTDLHASAEYRRHLAAVLARRALEAAWRRATEDAV